MSDSNPSFEQVVLPSVSLVLPCDSAVYDLESNKWILSGPWQRYRILDSDTFFPFREVEVWVYAQLLGGLGTSSISVEICQKLDVDTARQTYRTVGASAVTQLEFRRDQNRLGGHDVAFRLKQLPFRFEGIYEFRILAETFSGWQPLQGAIFEFTILDPRGRI